jgi:hypothetical protein
VRGEIPQWLDELRKSSTGDQIIQAIEGRLDTETDAAKVRCLKSELAKEHEAQGNEAAADARYRELWGEVHSWYRSLCRKHRHAHDNIIKAVEDRIRDEPDAAEIDNLYGILGDEYSFHGDHGAAEAIQRRLVGKRPDDPLPLISLAQPEQVMELINRALEVAYHTGKFRRFALGDKASIALELKWYDIVENVLREIMQLNVDPEVPDIGRERDFFDRLPPGSIYAEVARRSDEYCLTVGLRKRER